MLSHYLSHFQESKSRFKDINDYFTNVVVSSFSRFVTNPTTGRRDHSIFLKLVRTHLDKKRTSIIIISFGMGLKTASGYGFVSFPSSLPGKRKLQRRFRQLLLPALGLQSSSDEGVVIIGFVLSFNLHRVLYLTFSSLCLRLRDVGSIWARILSNFHIRTFKFRDVRYVFEIFRFFLFEQKFLLFLLVLFI